MYLYSHKNTPTHSVQTYKRLYKVSFTKNSYHNSLTELSWPESLEELAIIKTIYGNKNNYAPNNTDIQSRVTSDWEVAPHISNSTLGGTGHTGHFICFVMLRLICFQCHDIL